VWDLVVYSYVSNLPPLPNAPVPAAATSIGSENFIANWATVSNAIGYILKVYQGSNLIATNTINNAGATNFSIGGLTPNTNYTYTVIAKGDGINYSNSVESTTIAVTTANYPTAINTDFSDNSWGTPSATNFTTGAFPSNTLNGFILNSSGLITGNTKDNFGKTHTNRISIDKLSYSGKVILPAVSSLGQIEIHGAAGTAGNGITVKEYNTSTLSWDVIGTYIYEQAQKDAGVDSVYIIPINRSNPTKLSIENASGGGYYLYQIITRTTNPALLAKPTVGVASAISPTSFSANWTAVASATGYKVYVYQGTTLIAGAPFSVSGQTTESLAITDLTAETAYTYKVQAIGDNDVTLSDSFLSFAASVTTSTATDLDNVNQKISLNVDGKTITAPVTGNFDIYSLQGKWLLSSKGVNAINTNLPSGLYIVNFSNENGFKSVQKVAIK